MFDPVFAFFRRLWSFIIATISRLVRWIIAPFVAIRALYKRSHVIIKAALVIILLVVIVPYIYFFWNIAFIRDYDNNYAANLNFENYSIGAGEQVAMEGGTETTRTCGRSAIADVTADLIDFNVNRNQWISASLVYRLGLFGIAWDATPWMDNKASFQRGIHAGLRRTAIELADVLGRIRGTSQINKSLQEARGNLQIDEYNWYFGLNPFGVKQTAWGSYRSARRDLIEFNEALARCEATFDARADNLMQFLDRIAKDIGSTSAGIKQRAEGYNGGWFDTRADNVFMDAKGQLYAYYGLLQAARIDFRDIIESRALVDIWDNMEDQIKTALELDPLIISNGKEDGFIMPTHLTTIGFYILRVRSNLVEVRSVLDR